jgi:hypothetical protein
VFKVETIGARLSTPAYPLIHGSWILALVDSWKATIVIERGVIHAMQHEHKQCVSNRTRTAPRVIPRLYCVYVDGRHLVSSLTRTVRDTFSLHIGRLWCLLPREYENDPQSPSLDAAAKTLFSIGHVRSASDRINIGIAGIDAGAGY